MNSLRSNHKSGTPSLLGPNPMYMKNSSGMDLSQATPLLQNPPSSSVGQKQRVFTGVVSKMHDCYGIVDEDVFFQLSVVKGRLPQVGEKVLVKAIYYPTQTSKWNAQKIQVLNNQPLLKSLPSLLPTMGQSQKQGILGSKPQPLLLQTSLIPPLLPNIQQAHQKPGLLQTPSHLLPHIQHPRSNLFDARTGSRKRRGEGGREMGRWDDSPGKGADITGQKKRRWQGGLELKIANRHELRYSPLFSRFSRESDMCDTIELLRRYPKITVPDHFFDLRICWVETLPVGRPLTLRYPSRFHIAEPKSDSSLEDINACDSENIYNAKVLLLSNPGLEELYKKCCLSSEDQKDSSCKPVHPSSLIKFLVGMKEQEALILGGPWISSLDGPDPDKDPLVLIQTAIRCTRAQAGLDLITCSQWFRFAEVRYLHGERVETTVFFIPDVWHCMPSLPEWETIKNNHKVTVDDNDTTEDEQDKGKGESPPKPECQDSLPDEPSIISSPQQKAAGDKFTCATLSLKTLLECRQGSSEFAFEVFLMAELFNEMLQRDFGFLIYQTLCLLPGPETVQTQDKSEENNQDIKMTSEVKKEEEVDAKFKGEETLKFEQSKKTNDEIIDDCLLLQDDDEDDFGVSTDEGEMKSAVSNSLDAVSSKEVEKVEHNKLVLSRDVVLAFTYFDQNLCGFLMNKDLEEILHSLGLHLSPAQVKDLLSKFSSENKFHYRDLAASCNNATENQDKDLTIDCFVKGNLALLPPLPAKRSIDSSHHLGDETCKFALHKGAVVNIENLLQKLEQDESTRVHLECRINNLEARLGEALAQIATEEGEKKSLISKLEFAEKSLTETQEKLSKAEKRHSGCEKQLKENAGQLSFVIEKMQRILNKTNSMVESKNEEAEKEV
ncbi:cell cycle and apoptosis regulator protein 2 [Polypterus senegalus]|uniref:cell cycle and apoptosis regulator protein 2 n=1 Tax=Polypterus senegalus TaxID=55291 RepID=UPI0019653881|nr:cell cycle and apoptosis regulator protein 2 [Polypterus senegalus]XP_039625558.1 cell cycle and apoptosis regulator protein 2 [Polypterus senegalus]